jgi:REP element-mobilizing transposase RayT
MATPRSQLIDPELALHYHLVSRCVRRSWLCGRDRNTGKNYNHRKAWLEERLLHLAQYFAIEIDAFAIMDNHFHLVIFFDPKECLRWSDNEVAYRWCEAFPVKTIREDPAEAEYLKTLQRESLLAQPLLLARCRKTLGSVSDFMKHLKQPLAWRANREDRCTGHFFEGRFYCGALLSEDAVLAAMAYVDLNPVRAKIASCIEQCRDSSITMRLQATVNSPERLSQALTPLVSGIREPTKRLSMSVNDYCSHLTMLIRQENYGTKQAEASWYNRVASFRKRQRAYGLQAELEAWGSRRGWRRYGAAIPG